MRKTSFLGSQRLLVSRLLRRLARLLGCDDGHGRRVQHAFVAVCYDLACTQLLELANELHKLA